ncbi:MAG: hypothetical protein JW954_00115 [Dehalococcoidaceae bacterium]|nr:hypothetical protein [Dehalococcoidaceae bacterium]
MWKLILGIFFIVHGLIHWIYVAPEPNTAGARMWSFLTGRWIVTRGILEEHTAMVIGIVLISVITLGFAISGIGLLTSQEWWRVTAIASAVVSLVLVSLFWHNWMIAGPILNAVIIFVALFWDK